MTRSQRCIRHNIAPYSIPWLSLLLWRWNIGTFVWNIDTRPLRHCYCRLRHWYSSSETLLLSSETLVPILWDIGTVVWNIGTRPLRHWYCRLKHWYPSSQTLVLSSETLVPVLSDIGTVVWNTGTCRLKYCYLFQTLVPIHRPTCHHTPSKVSSPLDLTHNPEKNFKVAHTLKSRKSSFPAAGKITYKRPTHQADLQNFERIRQFVSISGLVPLYLSTRTWYARLTTAWELLSVFVEFCCDVRLLVLMSQPGPNLGPLCCRSFL
jgi:hypothetical protein